MAIDEQNSVHGPDATCAGCGVTKRQFVMNSNQFHEIKLSLNTKALVCRPMNANGYYAKESCHIKALAKANLCPGGCGNEQRHERGQLCLDCTTNLERGRAIETKLITLRIEEPWFGYLGADHNMRPELARVVAVAIAGSGARCGAEPEGDDYTGQPFADVTEIQRRAVLRLAAMIKAMCLSARNEGERVGQSFIHQLATGEAKIQDFNEAQTRLGREKQEG